MLSESPPASALELGFSVHLAVEARVKLNDKLFVVGFIAAIFLWYDCLDFGDINVAVELIGCSIANFPIVCCISKI